MAKRKSKKKSKSGKYAKAFFKFIGKILWFIIKMPYYFLKGSYYLGKKWSEKTIEIKTEKKRKSISSKHEEFKIVHVIDGDYHKWLDHVSNSDSQIGIIIGARGTGKTAFGIKFLENFHAKYNKKCFAIGFTKEKMPSWIKIVEDVSEIENDSMVLIDEGGILFSSRESMSDANKLLSKLILIARHKNMSILFISQNSSNLDVNILRQSDFLVLKPSSLLQKEFERKVIQKIYSSVEKDFEKFSEEKGITHIYANKFKGFVVNPLPSFWGEAISKSFK